MIQINVLLLFLSASVGNGKHSKSWQTLNDLDVLSDDTDKFSKSKQTITFDPSSVKEGPMEKRKLYMNAQEIISHENYPVETHFVTTQDGYVLQMIRIPRQNAIPVYLLHGALCTAREFLAQPKNQSLPFQLWDSGQFDVWLGNARGNSYSQGNVKYNTSDKRFWDFSCDDIFLHDNPTVIDYILGVTSQPKLIWIGYSFGAYAFFGTMSLRPDLNSKILQFVGLSPFTYLGNMTSPLRLVSPFATLLPQFPMIRDHGAFVPTDVLPFFRFLLPAGCRTDRNPLHRNRSMRACNSVARILAGINGNETNRAVIPISLGDSFPNRMSVQCVSQMLREISEPYFRHYDYGSWADNWKKYGQASPPTYNLTKITAPMIFYTGDMDALVDTKDVDRLADALPRRPRRRYVSSFNHLDFIFGRNAPDLYAIILEDLVNLIEIEKINNIKINTSTISDFDQ